MVGMGGEAEKLRGLFWRKPVWILEIPPKSSFKLFFFFLMWMIFYIFIEFAILLLLFCFFLASMHLGKGGAVHD